MKRREFAVLSGRTSRPSGATVVARRRGIRPSLPPSCDDAGWERLVILPPPGPFCSADSLLILGGLAIEGQPAGSRVRAYRGDGDCELQWTLCERPGALPARSGWPCSP